MSDNIWVAIIGLLGSGIGSLLGVIASSKLTNYRIEQLEKKVDKYNTVVERVYDLEKHQESHEKEYQNLSHRLEILENK